MTSYGGLTVDYVRQQGARVIVRGLRVYTDFEIEYQMALMTRGTLSTRQGPSAMLGATPLTRMES